MKSRYLRPYCTVESFSSAAAAKFHLEKEIKRVQLNDATLLCCEAPQMVYG